MDLTSIQINIEGTLDAAVYDLAETIARNIDVEYAVREALEAETNELSRTISREIQGDIQVLVDEQVGNVREQIASALSALSDAVYALEAARDTLS
jgi:macrodomain Ter protein organizer (MatP/YcbG family)